MNRTTKLVLTTAASVALVIGAVSPGFASTATVGVTAGTLAFVSTPGNPSLSSVTLNGTNQTSTGTLPIDVGDNTGSGTGWNITATSLVFTSSTHTLSTTATNVPSGPADACDASVTCTLATNAISYPYSLPAAATLAPTATKLYNAAANTGMANQTVTPSFSVAVPANTFAGSYTSTWTFSLVSAP